MSTDARPTPTPQPEAAQPRRSSYAMGTAANMVRSMVVILGLVGLMLLLVPRVSQVNRPAVDVHPVAVDAAASSGWALSEPTGLPEGWKPTSVRFVRSTDGLRTWHVGYLTPAGNYVALEQTVGATDAWVSQQTQRGRQAGELQAAGKTWEKFDRDAKVQRSLLDRGTTSTVTTLLTGTGTWRELAAFAGSLRPVG